MDTDTAAPRGNEAHIEETELATTHAAEALRRALSADDASRDTLQQVLRQLSALQAQMGEWKELHHILHRALAALSPFCANLRTLDPPAVEPADGRALLQTWRPCQAQLDRLMDLESRSEHIPRPSRHEGAEASWPDWGTAVASLRREIEERLREEVWSTEGLTDLVDELDQTCNCYLDLADRELRRAAERAQHLYTCLLGGLL